MFSWFQTQLNMENRFVCARKGVVPSPSVAAATHTRVNFVKKQILLQTFLFRSFIFFPVSFPAVWLKANLNHSSIMLECSNKEGGTTNRKTRPIFKSHLPRNSSLMLVSWLFQFTNVEKSTRKTHLNSNPKASKQKMNVYVFNWRFFDNRKLV